VALVQVAVFLRCRPTRPAVGWGRGVDPTHSPFRESRGQMSCMVGRGKVSYVQQRSGVWLTASGCTLEHSAGGVGATPQITPPSPRHR